MRIVAPYVKYVPNKDNFEHIAKAARICYAAEKGNKSDYAFVEELWSKRNHRSPYRHGTLYYEIPASFQRLVNKFINNPFCTCVYIEGEYTWFISTNCQFVKELDSKILRTLDNFIISEEYIYKCAKAYPELLDIIRVSFEIQTQISTSRELNRVSPNNICEQSTRYCNFANEKFGEDIAFCEPHWLDATTYYDKDKEEESDERIFYRNLNPTFAAIGFSDGEETQPAFVPMIDKWVATCYYAEETYFAMLKEGMLPQDARGILPLDTATKLFYTYSVKEWKHILDLRYKGTTGKPHPNAKIIATEIYNTLKELNLLGDYE